jgi:diguanylate cyclase (GGDEF)-like protein
VTREELGILLPDCTLGQPPRSEQICQAIATAATEADAPGIPISASLGVTITTRSGYELRQLMIHADEALYRAEREGRNRVSVANHPEYPDGLSFLPCRY